MKVADIYYQQMEKPDRDYTDVQRAEQEYRIMINSYPDSMLVPRAKQKLRDVQEVLAERETQIGLFYESREDFNAAIARLETVVGTYPLYSKSDQALLGIGDSYAGQARAIQSAPNVNGAVKERVRAVYQDKAAAAYTRVITRYPMSPHVEDARDRLVAMNRPVPSRLRRRSPRTMPKNAAVNHCTSPTRPSTSSSTTHGGRGGSCGRTQLGRPQAHPGSGYHKAEYCLFTDAMNAGKPAVVPIGTVAPTGVNEPPRSDQPSQAPLQMAAPEGGNGVGVQVVSAPASDPNAVVKAVGPANIAVPPRKSPPRP